MDLLLKVSVQFSVVHSATMCIFGYSLLSYLAGLLFLSCTSDACDLA